MLLHFCLLRCRPGQRGLHHENTVCLLRAIKPEGSRCQEITGAQKEAQLFGELGDTTNELCNDFHWGVQRG